MLTFSDLFWKQKEKKNNLCDVFWIQHQYFGTNIQHDILGLASRLYSLGVAPGKLVAMHHNSMQGFLVEWAVWILGGGIVYWDDTCNISDICRALDERKVSHIIVEDETWYLKNEEQLEELYDVIHILSLHTSEDIVPLTPASYDEQKLQDSVTNIDIFEDIALLYIDNQLKESTVLHKDLLYEQYQLEPTSSIHIPTKDLHKLRLIFGKYIFTNPIYIYEQMSFSYRPTDICFVSEDFFSQFVIFIKQTNATTTIGSYALQWYILLLQQLIPATNPSRRVHFQLLFFKKIIGSIFKDKLGNPLFVFTSKSPDSRIRYLNFRKEPPL